MRRFVTLLLVLMLAATSLATGAFAEGQDRVRTSPFRSSCRPTCRIFRMALPRMTTLS